MLMTFEMKRWCGMAWCVLNGKWIWNGNNNAVEDKFKPRHNVIILKKWRGSTMEEYGGTVLCL